MKSTNIKKKKSGLAQCNFVISHENHIKCSGYNAYQGGYGVHGNVKYSKSDRRNGKKACKEDY